MEGATPKINHPPNKQCELNPIRLSLPKCYSCFCNQYSPK